MNEDIKNNQNADAVDLYTLIGDIVESAKKLKWIIVLLICVGALANYLRLTVFRTPLYTSSITFTVSTKVNYGDEDISYSYDYVKSSDTDRFSKIFPSLITSGAMVNDLQEDVGDEAKNADISVETVKNSNLMELSATSKDPDLSFNVINSVFEHLPEISKTVIGEARYNIIEPAQKPTSPSNTPSLRKGMLVGAAAGLFAAAVVVVIYAVTRKTVRRSSEIKELFNINCLSVVPQISIKKNSKSLEQQPDISNPNVSNVFREEFYSIALRLIKHYPSKDGGKIFMFTSTLPGEGKTLCAYNTAKALAENGKNVLLIDMDFYHPSVHRFFEDKSQLKCDVVDVLLGKYDEAYRVGKSSLYVLAKENPQDEGKKLLRLFNSNRLTSFLNGLKKDWDYIVLDTPACTLISESSSLSEQCDALVYVIRQDYAKQNQIADGIQSVSNYGTEIAGCIFNGMDSSSMSNRSYYRYGKYGRYGRYSRYGRYGRYGGYGRYSRYGRYGRYGGYGSADSYGARESENDYPAKKRIKDNHAEETETANTNGR